MATPEGIVKAALIKRIKALGGKVRFVRWIGRRGAPDTLVLCPDYAPTYVETKAKGGRLSDAQLREIKMLENYGARVLVIWSLDLIDVHYPLLKGDDRPSLY